MRLGSSTSPANGLHECAPIVFGMVRPTKGCAVSMGPSEPLTVQLYTAPEVDGEFVVSGLSFCGSLLFYLATKHCFVDGNKRVAWLS